MQIIISPAKKMRVDNDDIGAARLPVFLTKTEELLTASACAGLQRPAKVMAVQRRYCGA